MIKKKVREKPDMQDYLRNHPWLIDPKWTMLVHEQSLDSLLCNELKVKIAKDDEGKRRLDFFCLGDCLQTAYVVEAKRPGDLVGRKEFDQVRDYVLFLRKKLQEGSTDPAHNRAVVKGLLIADRVREGDEGHSKAGQDAHIFDVRTWGNLLTTTEAMHKEFLDVTRMRAPADDPRMEELSDDNAATGITPRDGGASEARTKEGRKRNARTQK